MKELKNSDNYHAKAIELGLVRHHMQGYRDGSYDEMIENTNKVIEELYGEKEDNGKAQTPLVIKYGKGATSAHEIRDCEADKYQSSWASLAMAKFTRGSEKDVFAMNVVTQIHDLFPWTDKFTDKNIFGCDCVARASARLARNSAGDLCPHEQTRRDLAGLLQKARNKGAEMIIVGDFNESWHRRRSDLLSFSWGVLGHRLGAGDGRTDTGGLRESGSVP